MNVFRGQVLSFGGEVFDPGQSLLHFHRWPDESHLDGLAERTEGVTASFLKELLRRSAVLAADRSGDGPADDSPLAVTRDDLDRALEELSDTRNAMTRILLGSSSGSP